MFFFLSLIIVYNDVERGGEEGKKGGNKVRGESVWERIVSENSNYWWLFFWV